MNNIIDDFDKGIGLDRNKIVDYRSSQNVIFSKQAATGEIWLKYGIGWFFRYVLINRYYLVAFLANVKKSESKISIEARSRVG